MLSGGIGSDSGRVHLVHAPGQPCRLRFAASLDGTPRGGSCAPASLYPVLRPSATATLLSLYGGLPPLKTPREAFSPVLLLMPRKARSASSCRAPRPVQLPWMPTSDALARLDFRPSEQQVYGERKASK